MPPRDTCKGYITPPPPIRPTQFQKSELPLTHLDPGPPPPGPIPHTLHTFTRCKVGTLSHPPANTTHTTPQANGNTTHATARKATGLAISVFSCERFRSSETLKRVSHRKSLRSQSSALAMLPTIFTHGVALASKHEKFFRSYPWKSYRWSGFGKGCHATYGATGEMEV